MKCSNSDCKNEIFPQQIVGKEGLCSGCSFERWRTSTPDIDWDLLLKRVADLITGEDITPEDVKTILTKPIVVE